MKQFKSVLFLGLGLTVFCVACIAFFGRSFTLYVDVPVSITDVNSLAVTVDEDNEPIPISDSDILRSDGKSLDDGVLTLHLKAGKPGKVFLTVSSGDKTCYLDVFYVHPLGFITIDTFFGACNGCLVIPLCIIAFLAYVIVILLRALRENFRVNPYHFSNITYFAVILMALSGLLNQLIGLSDYRGFDSTIKSIIGSTSFFATLALPFVFIISIYVMISNIRLIRHEGANWRNLLGFILGVALLTGSVLPAIISEWLQRDSSFLDVHGMNRPDMYVETAVENIISFTVAYFECLLIATIFFAVKAARHIPAFDKDFILILGCQIRKDGSLTKLLQSRADRAVEFASMQKEAAGKDVIFVPSGGQGSDEVMPEAQAIRQYLLGIGIPDERILPEDQSVSTYENMRNSARLIKEAHPEIEKPRIAFSTTNYHVLRSGLIATSQGIAAEGIGSPTRTYFWINAFIREFIANLVAEKKKHLETIGILAAILSLLATALYFSNNH